MKFGPIKNCARCGGDHPEMEFRRLDNPVIAGNVLLGWWAPCPKNGQPILGAKVEEVQPDKP